MKDQCCVFECKSDFCSSWVTSAVCSSEWMCVEVGGTCSDPPELQNSMLADGEDRQTNYSVCLIFSDHYTDQLFISHVVPST